MTDGQQLFLLFSFLYLAESLRLVPPGAWLFSREAVGKVCSRAAFQALDLAGRRLLVLPVMPPLPVWAVLDVWRLVPAGQGLEVLEPSGQPQALLPWAEVKPVADGARLHLGGGVSVRFSHPQLAEAWAERLRQWVKMEPAAREADFEKLAARMLDAGQLEAALQGQAAATALLRHWALAVFALCFGILPLVYRWFGEGPQVMAAAAVLLVVMLGQAVIFWRATGRLAKAGPPGAKVPHRFWKALAIALLPQFAIRAADHVMEAGPVEAHPLATLPSLQAGRRISLARHFWRQMQRSQATTAPLQRRVLERFWRHQALAEADLREVPVRESGAAAYCPRCMAQFRDAGLRCQDCGGVELARF